MFTKKGKKITKKTPTSPPGPGPRAAPEKSRPAKGQAAAIQATTDDKGKPVGKDTSSLNQHLSFEGTLKFAGTVLIDCEFRGNIVTADTLVVGVSGRVHAEVTAGVVEISGVVRGDIKAANTVKIFSGGAVHGNIETPTISMEEGVIFEGNCTRPGKTPAPTPAPAPAPEAVGVSKPAEPRAPKPNLAPASDATSESGRKKMVVTAKELANLT